MHFVSTVFYQLPDPWSRLERFLVMKTTYTDLVECLEELSQSYQSDPPFIEAVILDGGAIITMSEPGHSKTFRQYGDELFLSYVQQ